jgi:O-antigen/teichoic acid export membrane protein
MLHALVPRNLRVRASVQVGGQRIPALGFILVAGVVFVGGLFVVFGANLERTVWLVVGGALGGLVVVEGRLWGRSAREVVRIVLRHYRRRRRLRRAPIIVALPAEPTGTSTPVRRPRWMEGGT